MLDASPMPSMPNSEEPCGGPDHRPHAIETQDAAKGKTLSNPCMLLLEPLYLEPEGGTPGVDGEQTPAQTLAKGPPRAQGVTDVKQGVAPLPMWLGTAARYVLPLFAVRCWRKPVRVDTPQPGMEFKKLEVGKVYGH